jgi:hypothetical protein
MQSLTTKGNSRLSTLTKVNNLIYASLLNEFELQKFIEFTKDHKGYQLQAREVPTNKTIKINY